MRAFKSIAFLCAGFAFLTGLPAPIGWISLGIGIVLWGLERAR